MNEFPDLLPPSLQRLSTSATETAEEERNKLGQEQFFQLMITQLQNQDPLKPLDSNEFLSQVAQFSTVSGIQDMQRSITQLVGSLQSSQALQASTLVGRDVLIDGNVAMLGADRQLAGALELPAATGGTTLSIFDASGQLVRQIDLGAQPAGLVRFKWDGFANNGQNASAGVYVVTANASFDGATQAVDTLVSGRVESVSINSHPPGATLNLSGGGSVGLDAVRELL